MSDERQRIYESGFLCQKVLTAERVRANSPCPCVYLFDTVSQTKVHAVHFDTNMMDDPRI